MPDKVLSLVDFAGLNSRAEKNIIGDKELSSVINFDIGLKGQLVKRTGMKLMANTNALGAPDSVIILGFFNTDTYKQFIAKSNNDLYYSTDAITWTLIAGGPWNAVECGVQYTDKFYMVRKVGTAIVWNGTAATAIVNSPAGTFCKVFKDRLFVINSEGAGAVASRLYFSNALDLTSTGWPATNYVGVNEGDGDRLIAISIVSDYLLVFKTKAIWNLFIQGVDTLGWILRPYRYDTGCISRHSIVAREGITYFCGLDGIYSTDGSSLHIISSPVGNFFDQITVDINTLNQVSAFFWKDKIVFSMPSYANQPLWSTFAQGTWNQLYRTPWAAGASSNVYLVYHIRRKSWTRWDFQTVTPHRFAVVTTAALKGVYCGERTSLGRILKFGDDVYSDLGVDILASFETKDFDVEKPTENKRGKWAALEVDGPGAYIFTSTISSNTVKVTSMTVASQKEIKVPGPGYFRIWRLGVSVVSNVPLTVKRVSLYVDAREYRPITKSSS